MSATDLKHAEVHVKEYRNCYPVLLIHIFGSEQRSKSFVFVLARFVVLLLFCFTYVPYFREGSYLTATTLNTLTVLQLLWHLNDREMLIIAWHVLKYFFTPRLQKS